MRHRPSLAVPVVALVATLLLASCDIGDGTTLQEPVAPTTLPPLDTTPLPSLPLDDPTLEQTPLIDSVVVGDAPGTDDPPDDTASDDGGAVEPFRIITPWAEGDSVNSLYTCDGTGEAPDVAWLGVPEGTVELAVSLVDESNPSNGRPFVHWVVAGIDPAVGQLVRNDLPPGAFEAINFFGDVAYGAPCPDPGTTGSYVLRLFAVGQQVESGFDTPASDVLDVVEAVSFDVATTSGTYTR